MSDFRTQPFPKSVVLELTYRCNHRCKFCSCPWEAPHSVYKKGRELSVEEWKQCIDILYDKKVVAFSISGGEALIKEGFEQIAALFQKTADNEKEHAKLWLNKLSATFEKKVCRGG